MPDYTSLNLQLAQSVRATIAYTDIRTGYLGKISAADTINPDPTEGLEQGFVWVRFHENGEAIKARCHKVSARMPDMPVRVGRDATTKEWTVLEVVPMDVGEINNLASTFSVPDRNDDFIYERFDANRFRSLHVIPGAAAFDVEVEPGFYWYHGVLKAFSGGTINITSSLPTGGYGGSKRGVLIGIDPSDNTLTTFDGEKIGINETPGNKGKYFTETYIADTVNDADSAIYWIALVPITSNDTDWRDLYRVTALQLTGSLGAALAGHGVRVNDVDQTQRGFVNFLDGNGITIAGVDDSANDETEITFTVDESQLLLENLGDVNITAPAAYDALYWDGSAWVNGDVYVRNTGDTMTGELGIQATNSPALSLVALRTLAGNDANEYASVTDASGINSNGFNATATVGFTSFKGIVGVVGNTGTITGVASMYAGIGKVGTNTLTNGYGNYIATFTKTGGTFTNAYGVYVEDQTVATNNYALYTNRGLVRLGDATSITQTATTGTPASLLTLTGAAHTSLTAQEYNDVLLGFNRTLQFSTGATIANQRSVYLRRSTITATGATQTITSAVTFEIEGAPVQSTNVTLTNTYALRVASGISRFDDALLINGSSSGRNQFVLTGASGQFVDVFQVKNFGGSNLFRLNSTGAPQISPSASTGTPESSILLTAPAHTALTASTEVPDVRFDFNRTVQWSAGALANQRFFYIRRPTIAFTSASTVTNAATVYIENSPNAGTNATITEAYSLWIDDGTLRLDGTLNHRGTLIGFNGATPTAQSTGWSVTNPTTRKSYDTTTITLPQLAQVVGTIIDYLKLRGDFAA